MANVTVSEIAGFGVGALLLIAASAAPKVDSFVARSQRRFSKSSLLISFSFSFCLCLSHLSFYTLRDFLPSKSASGNLNLLRLQGEIVAIACASCF
jgi:hypothetical protein